MFLHEGTGHVQWAVVVYHGCLSPIFLSPALTPASKDSPQSWKPPPSPD